MATNLTSNEFERYYVDLGREGGTDQLVQRLTEPGFATFDGITDRSSLLRLARSFVVVTQHRDSADDGVTAIAGDDSHPGLGYAGFGRGELLPHTEGSSLPHPPGLLLLTCVTAAETGDASFVVDGRELYAALASEDPAALRALAAPGSAYFGTGTGYLGSVFEHAGHGRLAIRLRLDELGRFSPEAARALAALEELTARLRGEFRLSAGQGYAVQNGRWLHGRRRFSGHREVLRILGHPQRGTAIRYGFTPKVLLDVGARGNAAPEVLGHQ